MRVLALLAVAVICTVPAQAADPYIERGAQINEKVSREAALAAAQYIQLWGYRCDSISSISPFIFSYGFNVYCNNYRYSYEIEDKGGNWIVTVD